MGVVTVVCTQDFAYRGKAIYEGQAVEMEAVDASIESRRGHVTLDRAARPTYQTRDMNAAPVAAVAAAETAPVASTEPAPKRRRRRRTTA